MYTRAMLDSCMQIGGTGYGGAIIGSTVPTSLVSQDSVVHYATRTDTSTGSRVVSPSGAACSAAASVTRVQPISAASWSKCQGRCESGYICCTHGPDGAQLQYPRCVRRSGGGCLSEQNHARTCYRHCGQGFHCCETLGNACIPVSERCPCPDCSSHDYAISTSAQCTGNTPFFESVVGDGAAGKCCISADFLTSLQS